MFKCQGSMDSMPYKESLIYDESGISLSEVGSEIADESM